MATAKKYPHVSYPTNTGDANTDLLNKVKNDYMSWWRYTIQYRQKWESYWKLWNNQRIRRQYWGDNDSFEPMTVQMVETTVDNVYGNRPKLTFLPRNRYQDSDPKRLNLYWDYTWDENNMDQLLIPWGRENTIIGNGALFIEWGEYCMGIKHVPFEDCFFDPASPDPQNGRYAGYRRLEMLDNLKTAERFDPDKGEWVPRYTNLDSITTSSGNNGDVTDREYKDMRQGTTFFTDEDKARQVEVLYICYLDQIVEIANRSTVIYQGPNPYHKDAYKQQVTDREDNDNQKLYNENSVPPEAAQAVASGQMTPDDLEAQLQPVMKEVTIPEVKPFLPFAMQRDLIDPALPIARGLVELFANVQEDLNDVVNEKKDNLAYAIKAVGALDPAAGDVIDDIAIAKPGDIVKMAPGHFQWLPKDDLTAAADLEINRLKQTIQSSARVSAISMGQVPTGVRTAVEINSLISIASNGFKVKQKSLESQAYNRLGRMFIWCMQIFCDDKIDIPALDTESDPQVFDPEPYWGDWNVKVQLESDAHADKTQQAQQAMEMRQAFLGDPNVDQHELDKLVLQRGFDLDEDEVAELMPDQPAMPPGVDPGLPGAPGGPGMPPGAPPAPGTPPTALPMMARPTGKPNA